jgi:glycosyltransferase involved in cell wall biosynthesis
LTNRPVLGVVQWLFAVEKSKQYHLPFHVVERVGLASHRRLIAVSEDLAHELRIRNPTALVSVVGNGLPDWAFLPRSHARSNIVYLGRIEIAQKGLDILVTAYARIASTVPQDLVFGGDGPDRGKLEQMVADLGVTDRVHFVGWISSMERFDWLASADFVAMPSRNETFGLVAAEALAVQTPIVAFDIPSLRALVGNDVGIVVPAFDTDRYAQAMCELALDPIRRAHLGAAGPAKVNTLSWDTVAQTQGKIYREVMADQFTAPSIA